MQLNKKTVLNLSFLLFAVLRLQNYFFPIPALKYLSAVLLVGIVLITIPTMGKGTRRVLVTLFVVGTALLIYAKVPLETWVNSILKNGNLLALFVLVPMISAPFYYEDYQSELSNLAKMRMHSVLSFLLLVAVANHILSVIVSIGSVLVTYSLLAPYASLYKAEKPFLTTLSRSYNSSGFWSPAWASVIVYSAVPNVEWVRVIPVGIAMSVLFLAIHFAGLFVETRRYPDRYPDIHADPGTVLDKKKLTTMLILAICMILTIVVINVVTGWDLMITVCIASLVFPLGAALFQKKMPEYKAGLDDYYHKQLQKVKGQVALFMMSGFFGNALSVSGVGELLARCLPDWLTAYPPLMIAALMLILILPSLIGVHPAATGTALVAALTPAAVGLSNYTFSLAIIVGWLLTIMVAPYSASALLFASLTGKNHYHTSIGINWGFGLICLVVFSLLISVIGPVMG